MESAHPGAEAQAIAVLIREALEVPERRVALVTPDRGLASRVAALLRRWDIEADDSAGEPLAQSVAACCCCCWPSLLPSSSRLCR